MAMDEKPRFSELSSRMRREWDRRVAHDYRYWMSDGVESDSRMWETGERDLDLLFDGIPAEALRTFTAAEVGCGVGRLLRAAARRAQRVIGVDISPEAIEEARQLLAGQRNVEFRLGNGYDLSVLESGTVDLLYSFAALGSMPVSVIASYFAEFHRVLRPGGIARLQMYLGSPQQTVEEDTIALRSFERGCFERAMALAGFALEWDRELILPFEVSDPESGLVATLVSLRREIRPAAPATEIAAAFLPSGEQRAGGSWAGSSTEYLMALARAKQLMDEGNEEAARTALRFAVANYGKVDEEVRQILREMETIGTGGGPAQPAPDVALLTANNRIGGGLGGDLIQERCQDRCLQGNLDALRQRFPELARRIAEAPDDTDFEVRCEADGRSSLWFRQTALIHPAKPERAAESWAEQLVRSPRYRAARQIIVGGLGLGYHIEALGNLGSCPIHLFEPNLSAVRAAFAARDLRATLRHVRSWSTTIAEVRELLREDIEAGVCYFAMFPTSKLVDGAQFDELKRSLISVRAFRELKPRIAVVGPMYGGSLPISYYTVHGFQELHQRVKGYDFKAFYQSFQHLGSLLKTPSRKDAVETQYVELLSRALVESLAERPIDILVCLAQAPVSPAALTELRERGIITVMWFVEDYRRFTTWRMIAPYFDYMFMIQRGECLNLVEAAGAGRAVYLPVACDPMIHRPLNLTAEEQVRYGSDISFFGAGYNNRRHMFTPLANRDFKIWGTEWPACLPFTKLVQDGGRRMEPDEYVKIFSATKINLNLHSSSERDGVEPFGDFVNPRTFELASCGAFQLVDDRTLLPELFEAGKEIAVFRDGGELTDQIQHYLAHPEERLQMAEAARSRALREHTYEHRLRQMLEHIFLDRYEQLREREATSPWQKTLDAAKDLPDLLPRLEAARDRGDDPTLDSLISDIHTGQGSLKEVEQKLLFLHHLRAQIATVQELRKERS